MICVLLILLYFIQRLKPRKDCCCLKYYDSILVS